MSLPITGKGKGEENNEQSKGKSKGTEGAIQVYKGSGNGKTLKTGILSIENLKSETSCGYQESAQMGQVRITQTPLVHEEWMRTWTQEPQSTHLKRILIEKELEMEVRLAGSQMSKLSNFKDSTKCKPRSLNERLTDAHRVLGSIAPASASAPASEAAEIAYKEQQDFYVGHFGGYMSLIHSKLCQGMRIHFGKLVNEHGMSDFIPVFLAGALEFYPTREGKAEEIYSVNEAEQCLEKENQRSGNEHG